MAEKTEAPRSDRGYSIYATTAVSFFGSHFRYLAIASASWNYVYGLILALWKNFVEDRMSKFYLEKKLQPSELHDFRVFCPFCLTNWLTDWHRKFPLIFDHLHLSDFEKWGLFGKLTPWGVRRYKNLGPHSIRIQNFPPFSPKKAYNGLFVGE